MKKNNLIGKKFGHLKVIKSNITKNKIIGSWICECLLCGKNRIFYTSDLLNGHNISCGKCGFHASRTHGLWNTTFYKKWETMNRRCFDKKADNYNRYGLIGIKVCKRWQDPLNFKNDMYESYLEHCKKFGKENTTIDRINNEKDYSPSNCRWATHKEQSRNTKNNLWLEYNGKKMIVTDWAELFNIKPTTLFGRIRKGMTIEQALNWKFGKHFKKITPPLKTE